MEESKSAPIAKITGRAKPTIITIGKKQVISSGQWNNAQVIDYVIARGSGRWITVGELARFVHLHASPTNKGKVRRCLARLYNALLFEHGLFLVTEYGPHNQAMAVKLLDQKSELELQAAELKLDRMRKRREMSNEQYDEAMRILREASEAA